eukprot:CAMPEP_0114478486 /NCGR_PEP_ID=MMETSP0104-20121206/16012_1 /TAXON_ID=37642 ORGANISM="Paraphysomonas imperforata, Strain PA2" /NCGR_SAMPLE_ID=MMETSP0104 /ASSEMBLY_ACC=CAM_ASM_000202 /LENGTH=104 /DNA_ID=CAMNT_0001653683 /DNA_START=696 /DNA_END=1010 /DNA_ORIENTATION=-
MWYNNSRTHVWSLTGYASATLSLFMTIDGIWRICYYRLYSGQSFEDIPVGFGIVNNSLSKDILFVDKNNNSIRSPSSALKETEFIDNPIQYSNYPRSSFNVEKA